ncbi:MAG TPA: M15 family metallopeptidase [Bacteroidia bacterium]
MKDQITLQRIELLHPKVKGEVKAIYDEICAALTGTAFCRFAYTLRTFKEQNDLYAKGRTIGGSKVTNAKGGESCHNYGLAVDIVLIDHGRAVWERGQDFDGDKIPDWMEVVKIFEKYGWFWGGNFKSFKDYPHFEKSFGFSASQLKAKWETQGKPTYVKL